jgi:hypothetical protein
MVFLLLVVAHNQHTMYTNHGGSVSNESIKKNIGQVQVAIINRIDVQAKLDSRSRLKETEVLLVEALEAREAKQASTVKKPRLAYESGK